MFVFEEAPPETERDEANDASSQMDDEQPPLPPPRTYPVTCAINPSVISRAEDSRPGWESCVSIPGIAALVDRPYTIHVEYTDENGQPVRRTLQGDTARLFLHEYDHLEGLSMLDRVADKRRIVMANMVDEFEMTCDDVFGDEYFDDVEEQVAHDLGLGSQSQPISSEGSVLSPKPVPTSEPDLNSSDSDVTIKSKNNE
mmetsp:Transcript_27745/g.45107  ORF Transcript_27745/g.45107 Transcript_27745/m.45107 type:complete len:199 (+) Transcript_27745:301-897(+)